MAKHKKLLRFTSEERLFVLSGAGISAASGLPTFRGLGGLWHGHRLEEVATPAAWRANPELVWRFYSNRRRDALAAEPNAAHIALAALEQRMGDRFYLCTQNVDDLHERAGSHRIHHMHGSLFQSRCVSCNRPFPDRRIYGASANLPKCRDCGDPVRPHVVWFGEMPLDMNRTYAQLDCANVLLVVGTSGTVYPAAGFADLANGRGVRTIYVGPEEPLNADAFREFIQGPADEVLPRLHVA